MNQKKNFYYLQNKTNVSEDIKSSCLDYVLVALSVAPYLKDEIENLITDINQEPNNETGSRYWKQEEVIKVTSLLKALK
tara:strand:+ start:1134 stop:1370 length:237 start_codon:yes stop_codon:yes gene_type:complete